MITITQSVEECVRHAPFIEESISRGLLNLSAYARTIRPSIEEKHMKPVTLASVVMALKRLQPRCRAIAAPRYDFVRLKDITVESTYIEYTFRNSQTLSSLHRSLIDLTEKHDLCMNFVQGIHESTLIIHRSLEREVDELAQREVVTGKIPDLTLITIRLPSDTVETPGVYYPILKALAWEGINVIEVISVASELTIVLREGDAQRAFGAIKGLIFSSNTTAFHWNKIDSGTKGIENACRPL